MLFKINSTIVRAVCVSKTQIVTRLVSTINCRDVERLEGGRLVLILHLAKKSRFHSLVQNLKPEK